jgi:hypothetical protein
MATAGVWSKKSGRRKSHRIVLRNNIEKKKRNRNSNNLVSSVFSVPLCLRSGSLELRSLRVAPSFPLSPDAVGLRVWMRCWTGARGRGRGRKRKEFRRHWGRRWERRRPTWVARIGGWFDTSAGGGASKERGETGRRGREEGGRPRGAEGHSPMVNGTRRAGSVHTFAEAGTPDKV